MNRPPDSPDSPADGVSTPVVDAAALRERILPRLRRQLDALAIIAGAPSVTIAEGEADRGVDVERGGAAGHRGVPRYELEAPPVVSRQPSSRADLSPPEGEGLATAVSLNAADLPSTSPTRGDDGPEVVARGARRLRGRISPGSVSTLRVDPSEPDAPAWADPEELPARAEPGRVGQGEAAIGRDAVTWSRPADVAERAGGRAASPTVGGATAAATPAGELVTSRAVSTREGGVLGGRFEPVDGSRGATFGALAAGPRYVSPGASARSEAVSARAVPAVGALRAGDARLTRGEGSSPGGVGEGRDVEAPRAYDMRAYGLFERGEFETRLAEVLEQAALEAGVDLA